MLDLLKDLLMEKLEDKRLDKKTKAIAQDMLEDVNGAIKDNLRMLNNELFPGIKEKLNKLTIIK